MNTLASTASLVSFLPRSSVVPAQLDVRFNNSLVDSSPNGNTSATSAGVSYTTVLPAQGTHSATFTSTSGAKAYVQFTSVAADVATAITVALWLKVTGVVDTGAPVYFDIGTSATSYGVHLRREAGQAYDATGANNKNYSVNGSSTFALRDNTWFHLAFVVSNGSSSISWFKNGATQPALTSANTANYPSATSSINTVRIGGSISAADKGLIGQIDQFQIYAAVLDATAIGAMVALGNGFTGSFNDMYLFFKFDQLYNTNYFMDEVSGNNNGGNALHKQTCTLDTTTRKFGAGSIRNNGSQWSRIAASSYIFAANSNHSFAFWIYIYSAAGASQPVFVWSTTNWQYQAIGLRLTKSGSVFGLEAMFDNAATTPLTQVVVSPTIVASTWYHVAVSFQLQTGTCTCYLNGVAQTPVTFSTAFLNTSAARAYRDILAYPGASINANMDDFRHYERLLTAEDVVTLFNNTY